MRRVYVLEMQAEPKQSALDPHRLNTKNGLIVPYIAIDYLEQLAFQWKALGGSPAACAEDLETIIENARHRDRPPKLPKWLPVGVMVSHCGITFQAIGELRLVGDDEVPCYTGLFREVTTTARPREDLFVVLAAEVKWTQYYRLLETLPSK